MLANCDRHSAFGPRAAIAFDPPPPARPTLISHLPVYETIGLGIRHLRATGGVSRSPQLSGRAPAHQRGSGRGRALGRAIGLAWSLSAWTQAFIHASCGEHPVTLPRHPV